MAPEILNYNSFSAKSDIYSLGITLLELMTGSKNKNSLDQIQIPEKFKKINCKYDCSSSRCKTKYKSSSLEC
jgi:serine/threonine protein kinase